MLINPNKENVDSVDFGKASVNQSYSKTQSGWLWNNNLTPGEKNIISQSWQSTPAKSSKEEIKEPESGSRAVESVDINLSNQKSKPPVWLIALIVAVFSGIVVLIVKNSLF